MNVFKKGGEVKWGRGTSWEAAKEKDILFCNHVILPEKSSPSTPVEFYFVHFKTSCSSAIIIWDLFTTWFHFQHEVPGKNPTPWLLSIKFVSWLKEIASSNFYW